MASKIVITGRISEGSKATFGVTTDMVQPYKYQWKKNGVPIAGAPSAPSYTTPDLRRADMGNKYSVTVWGRLGVEEEAPEIGFWEEKR